MKQGRLLPRNPLPLFLALSKHSHKKQYSNETESTIIYCTYNTMNTTTINHNDAYIIAIELAIEQQQAILSQIQIKRSQEEGERQWEHVEIWQHETRVRRGLA